MSGPLSLRVLLMALGLMLLLLLAVIWLPFDNEVRAIIATTLVALSVILLLLIGQWQRRSRRVHPAQRWLTGLHEIGRGYALCDRDGQILDCNRAFAALCQMPAESLMRRDVNDTVFVQAPALWPELRHCILSGMSWRGQITLADNALEVLAFPLTSLAEPVGPHLIIELLGTVVVERDTASSQLAMDRLPAGLVIVREQHLAYVNEGFSELFGLPIEQLIGLGLDEWLSHDPILKQMVENARQQLFYTDAYTADGALKRADDSTIWCQFSATSLVLRQPDQGFLILLTDASELRRREESLRQAAVVFEAASDTILVLDAERRIRMVNSAFSSVTGFGPKEILGRAMRLLLANRQPPEVYDHAFAAAAKDNVWQGELWSRKKDGTVYPQWVSINAVRNDRGLIVEYVVIASDITDRKRAEERLNYQANYDALTALPNRNLFMDRLHQAISRAKREGTQLALVFIDLDRFKNVNDTLGHSAGDKLLIQVAEALRGCVRESDTIARFGGDEFSIILSPIYGPKNAATVAQTLLTVLSKPVLIDGYECLVGGSIGVTLFPTDGSTPEELVKNADAAMYRAKDEGRNTYQFFTQEMQQQALSRVALERDLRYALERHEFLLYYQPQIGVKSQTVVGLEVLVRWQSNTRGFVSPAEFIGLAEENGQIVALGEWVLREACTQYVRWLKEGLAPPCIAVNVSGRQFRSPHFIRSVETILAETGIPTSALELELTESFLMEDEEKVLSTLNTLRQMGLSLSVDDFGTGYSSLSYLKRFPISTLKIDKSFVNDVPGNEEDEAIVAAILRMASALKLEVVAEGVETAAQLAFLESQDCDVIQGYFYSKPLSKADCAAYLSRYRYGLKQGPGLGMDLERNAT